MIEFKPITVADKERITSYTMRFAPMDCALSFGNLCGWNYKNGNGFAEIAGCLLFRFILQDGRECYSQPIGEGDIGQVIDALEDTAAFKGQPLCFWGSSEGLRAMLEKYRTGAFEYTPLENSSDYIYLRSNLAELKGKRYQPKRNHINNFIKQYDYRYTDLTPSMLPQCVELENQWFTAHSNDSNSLASYEAERKALNFYVAHYEELGLIGGAIWVGDKLAAFTLGSPINHNTFDTHIEKASSEFETAYSVINRDFAARLPSEYIYINREEDLGLEGLRRAKLSYHPEIILTKCIATKI